MINVYLCPESENGKHPKIIPFIKQRTPARNVPFYKSLSTWKRVHQPRITTLVFSFQNQHAQKSASRNNPAGITVHAEMDLWITCDWSWILKPVKGWIYIYTSGCSVAQFFSSPKRLHARGQSSHQSVHIFLHKVYARLGVRRFQFSSMLFSDHWPSIGKSRELPAVPQWLFGMDLHVRDGKALTAPPRVAHPIFLSGLSFDYLRWCLFTRILVHRMRRHKFSPIIFHPIKWAVIITARRQHAPLPDNYVFQYSTYWLMSGCNLTPTVSVPREKRGLIARG